MVLNNFIGKRLTAKSNDRMSEIVGEPAADHTLKQLYDAHRCASVYRDEMKNYKFALWSYNNRDLTLHAAFDDIGLMNETTD